MTGHPVAAARWNAQFHPDGHAAACLSGDGDVEFWDLRTGTCHRVGRTPAPDAQPVPVTDGRVLLAVNAAGGPRVVDAGAGHDVPLPAGVRAMRLLAGPVTVAFLRLAEGVTAVATVDPDLRLRPVTRLTGTVAGGLWLDPAGQRLAVLQRTTTGVRTRVIDLTAGVTGDLPGLDPGHRLLLTHPVTGRLLVSVPGGLALSTVDNADVTTALPPMTGSLLPLAFDPDGRRVALRANRGARSVLLSYDPRRHRVEELPVPEGLAGATAAWNGHGLHVLFSTPDHPPVITVPAAGRVRGPSIAHRTTVAGAAGPVEAVVYGGPRWRDAPHLILALHGGPEDAWRMGWDPLFRRFAADGTSVVAVNQRGSTGYGTAHRDAVVGDWGGPDLADVRRCAADLAAYRRERGLGAPALYGVSYGAYLALLAAAVQPESIGRVAVAAPFLSATRLYQDAAPPVRAMLDRLDARRVRHDGLGPRDVLRLLGRRPVPPLLVVHGDADAMVPVGQSRALAASGVPLTYREVPGAGHDVLATHPASAAEVAAFLTAAPRPEPGHPGLRRPGSPVAGGPFLVPSSPERG